MNYDETRLSIQQWADEDKPREKLLLKGTAALSDAELLAILIRSGTPQWSAVDLARNLLADYQNNINELAKASPQAIIKRKGIGPAKGLSVIAALELGRRRQQQLSLQKPVIQSSAQSFTFLAPILADLAHEEFYVVYLNRASVVLAYERISAGGLTSTVVDIRLILKYALLHNATSILMSHNHPSGNMHPSMEDDRITKKVSDSCKLMDIGLIDHVIVTQTGYYSYADEGKL